MVKVLVICYRGVINLILNFLVIEVKNVFSIRGLDRLGCNCSFISNSFMNMI